MKKAKKNTNILTIAIVMLLFVIASCNSMPEFMRMNPISTDSLITLEPTEHNTNIDTLFNTTVDTVSPSEVLQPTSTTNVTQVYSDCKSFWMNIIQLQKQQDLNELYSRYSKTFTKSQLHNMLDKTGKYTEDIFTLNEAMLCERYEKLKIGWFYRLHANEPMIIDTAGKITFVPLKKNK